MSKKVLVKTGKDPIVIDIPISTIDDVETIKIMTASSLKLPLHFLNLEQNDTTIEESVLTLPIAFRTSKKMVQLTDIQTMNISFNTIEEVIEKSKKSSISDVTKNIQKFFDNNLYDSKYCLFVNFYYMFGKARDAEFLDNPNSSKFREDYAKTVDFIDYIKADPVFGLVGTFQREYNLFIRNLKVNITETENKANTIKEVSVLVKRNKDKRKEISQELSKERIKYVSSKITLSPFYTDDIELFENLALSRDVPYAKLGNFTKVLKSFSPPEEFIFNENTKLTLFVLNKNNEPLTNIDSPKMLNYSVIVLSKINDSLEIIVDTKVEGFDANTDVKEEVVIQRIINALNVNNKIGEMDFVLSPTYFKGEIYLPFKHFSRIILHDIVMNNSFISKLFVINERFTTINKKGGVGIIYLPSEKTNYPSVCSMTNSVVSSANKRFIQGTKLRLGDIFTSFTFRTKNEKTLKLMVDAICDIISVYRKEEPELLSYYDKFSLDFQDEKNTIDKVEKIKKKSVKKDLKLKDYLPDLFVKKYPAKCGNQPIIIEDEKEALQKIEKGIDIMKYPLFNEFDSYYYSCENHKEDGHIYPGLKRTNLVQYLVPCCYATRQEKFSDRGKYEAGKFEEEEEEEEKISKTFAIYKTSRIMKVNRYGYLAKDVANLLKVIDIENTYLRTGVNKGINSCIEAILRATRINEELDKMDSKQRDKFLKKERLRLIKYINQGSSAQDSYLYSSSSLIDYIKQDKYVDIRLFKDALQNMYDCNIYIFQINKDHINGELVSPYYTNNIYALESKRNYRYTVLLYETAGSRIDNLYYPHYEYISRYSVDKNKISSTYSSEDVITEGISKVYVDIYMKFSKQLKTSVPVIPFNTPIISQTTDSFGKTRIIYFEGDVNIITQPLDNIPSSRVQENITDASHFKPVDYDKAIAFINKEKIVNYKFSVIEERLVGIYAKKKMITFYIPIISTLEYDKDVDTTQDTYAPSFMLKENILVEYCKRLRAARNLSSVALYVFSKYINLNNKSISDEDLEKTVLDFSQECIVVNPEIKEQDYVEIPRKLEETLEGIQNKVYVVNKKMRKKLSYFLFIKTRQNSRYILGYKDLEFIPNYYQDVRDFKINDNDTIFFSNKESVVSWKKYLKLTKPFEIKKSINIELWQELNDKQLVLFQNKNITNSSSLYTTVKAVDIYAASAFFNTLKRTGKVDVKRALVSPEDKKLSFRGKMVFINDEEGVDKIVKEYGEDDYIIAVFNYNGEVKLLCLFKYKL
jgi:hypothetical protein